MFTLWSLICLLVKKKKKSNKHQPNHASLFLTGSVFNTEPAPAFISPRLPPLRASRVNRTQWSREESHQVPSLKGCLAGPGKNWDCRPSQHLPYMPAHTDSKLASRQRRPGLEPHKGSRRGEGKEAQERKASPLLFFKASSILGVDFSFLFFFHLAPRVKGLTVMETGGHRFIALPLDFLGWFVWWWVELPQPFSPRTLTLISQLCTLPLGDLGKTSQSPA